MYHCLHQLLDQIITLYIQRIPIDLIKFKLLLRLIGQVASFKVIELIGIYIKSELIGELGIQVFAIEEVAGYIVSILLR